MLICSYLLLFPLGEYLSAIILNTFVVLFVVSNVAINFLDDSWFTSWSFYYPLVIADTIVLTLSLMINGTADTEFYLIFFLVIISSCIVDDAKLPAAVAILATIIYATLLFISPQAMQPAEFLRLPFLFVVSLFYGYFTQFIRMEKAHREQAEFTSRARKEALDIVSHELRTPLNLIGGYAGVLKDGTLGEVNAKQEEALGKILRQSDNLLSTVNSVLDMARIEDGELTVVQEEIRLPDFFQGLRLYYDASLGKPVSMRWLIPSELPTIRSDRAKLMIVLQNLINNAIKFTEHGQIEVSARHSGDKMSVEIEVKDSGIGIPQEALPVIFEKFRQADNSSTRNYGGVGLGLHIVKAFTEALGGSVAVASQPGKGSTFTLSLPV
ncbi:MAG TPA: HAMP domain-containing sensor histidine kinase [Candidatus Binatia bacterium]|nr:HAMP domain-containing sensor histidine kinase [Candidatus Binatia bacterium]